MKEYAYERIKVSGILGSKIEGHKEIIEKYAKEGYRYVGFIPTTLSSYGGFKELDLIFEIDRQVKNNKECD